MMKSLPFKSGAAGGDYVASVAVAADGAITATGASGIASTYILVTPTLTTPARVYVG